MTTKNTALAPITSRELLLKAKDALASVLPKHLNADRILRMANFALSQSEGLRECHPQTVLAATMKAAALGLDVGGALGHAYLVPHRNGKTGQKEATLIVGYKGFIDLALRSGRVSAIEAATVDHEDIFDYELGLAPFLRHKPRAVDPQPAGLEYAYAIARFSSGVSIFVVLTRPQIDARRKRSASSSSSHSPWQSDYAAMAKKSAIRALANLLPQSPELAAALELDRRDDGHEPGFSEVIDVLPDVPLDASAKPTSLAEVTSRSKASREPAPADDTGDAEPPADVVTTGGREPGSEG